MSAKRPSTLNIVSLIKQKVERHPFKRAVVSPVGRSVNGRTAYTQITFLQLDRESDRMAHGFEEIGISRGVRTILMVKPSLEFFILTFALFKVGAVPVVVDPGMGVGRMLKCLKEGQARAFIGIPKAHVLRSLAPSYFRTVRTWLTVGRRWFWGGVKLTDLGRGPYRPYQMTELERDEMAAILFTTGSTGPAKGAVYTHGNFEAQVRHIQTHFQITPDEIDLPTFPLFALFDPALGMTAVIPDMDPTRPGFVDPEKIIGPIVDHGVTNMFGSPALLDRVGRYGMAKGIALPSMKRVVSAGAPVAPVVIERFSKMLDHGAEMHTPYGATEAMPVASIGSREILSETGRLSEEGRGICVGRPLEGVDVRIIRISDDPIPKWSDDLTAPDGEIGEITVRGDQVTGKYYERPLADTLAKIDDNPRFWHRMGDLGWRDPKGRIWFCGRKGHRVATEEGTLFTIPCEAIFNNHPKVFRSALIGVGPPSRQKPVICIELEKNLKHEDLETIRNELLAMAHGHELTASIKTVLFHKAFPVDIRHNSKIFREKLAEWAAKQLKTNG